MTAAEAKEIQQKAVSKMTCIKEVLKEIETAAASGASYVETNKIDVKDNVSRIGLFILGYQVTWNSKKQSLTISW